VRTTHRNLQHTWRAVLWPYFLIKERCCSQLLLSCNTRLFNLIVVYLKFPFNSLSLLLKVHTFISDFFTRNGPYKASSIVHKINQSFGQHLGLTIASAIIFCMNVSVYTACNISDSAFFVLLVYLLKFQTQLYPHCWDAQTQRKVPLLKRRQTKVLEHTHGIW
jgi:hypothetical protein